MSHVLTPALSAQVTRPVRRQGVKVAAAPPAVPLTRRLVGDVLAQWQLESISDPALLLVSELVTNAVQASGGCAPGSSQNQQAIVLTVVLTETSLLLEVWDASPLPPVLQEADITGDRGRGLMLVDFLADAWGYRPENGGKVVWCELKLLARLTPWSRRPGECPRVSSPQPAPIAVPASGPCPQRISR